MFFLSSLSVSASSEEAFVRVVEGKMGNKSRDDDFFVLLLMILMPL